MIHWDASSQRWEQLLRSAQRLVPLPSFCSGLMWRSTAGCSPTAS
jgi:hypothetical protein